VRAKGRSGLFVHPGRLPWGVRPLPAAVGLLPLQRRGLRARFVSVRFGSCRFGSVRARGVGRTGPRRMSFRGWGLQHTRPGRSPSRRGCGLGESPFSCILAQTWGTEDGQQNKGTDLWHARMDSKGAYAVAELHSDCNRAPSPPAVA
jgi:hypothetical protein